MIQVTLMLSDERKAFLDGLAASLHDPDTMLTPKNSEVLRASIRAFARLSKKEQRQYVSVEMEKARMGSKRGPKPRTG